MLKARMQQLWQYNQWGWERLLPHLEQLAKSDEDAYFQERPFFWQSLHGLAAHSFAAELLWFERCQGRNPTKLLGSDDFSSLDDLRPQWALVQQQWSSWIDSLSEDELQTPIHYQGLQGTQFVLPAADIIQHVVNHGTEHRSQMTPVLFELGHATRPTDFLFFVLEQSGQEHF